MWTTHHNPNVPAGCNFYLSKYGVRIQQASNTLIVWRPEEEHGTSLPNFDPKISDPSFCQRAIAFVTSNRLPSAWKKLQSGLLTMEEVSKLAVEHDERDIKYK